MTDLQHDAPTTHASSTGQALTGEGWLDIHFEACLPEYEAMLRSVEIEPGWHVLDAGCGSGSYLPLLSRLVGETGRITALDLATENIAAVQERLVAWGLPCPIQAQVGKLTALPYPDGGFDAIWSANVTQYLDDEELPVMLAECRRVLRPGGILAIKDVDMQLMRIYPADPFLVAHLTERSIEASQVTAHSQGSVRGRELRRWLERAGFVDVWQRTALIERWAPLTAVERQLYADWFAFLALLALERGVPEADLSTWRLLRDPAALDNPINHPDFYACEGQVVVVGRTPEKGS